MSSRERELRTLGRVESCSIVDEAARKLWEVFVDVFTVQEADKHNVITAERDANAIFADADSIVITAAFKLFEI
ncbi:MAG TPA: hypothetical protein VEM96_09650 [Pyrinomonadaceae bacterium]|nr:hypothetical protein [Pyrinomonadaceae bacterium]